MDRINDFQPDRPIDARSGIPAAVGLGEVIDVDKDLVAPAILKPFPEPDPKRNIPRWMESDTAPIEPDGGIAVDTLKVKPQLFVPPVFRDFQIQAVPSFTGREVASPTGGRGILPWCPGDTPVMREGYWFPVGPAGILKRPSLEFPLIEPYGFASVNKWTSA